MSESHFVHSMNLSGLILSSDFLYLSAFLEGMLWKKMHRDKVPFEIQRQSYWGQDISQLRFLEFGNGLVVDIINILLLLWNTNTVASYKIWLLRLLCYVDKWFWIIIDPDKELFEKISRKHNLFFEKAIFPELLAKCFSEPTN